jgi:hypothetical protein
MNVQRKKSHKKLGRAAQKRISKKIAILRREGYPAAQAAAIAYKYERAHKLGPRGGKKRNPKYNEFSYCLLKKISEANGIEADALYNQISDEGKFPELLASTHSHLRLLTLTSEIELKNHKYFITTSGLKLMKEMGADENPRKRNPVTDEDVYKCIQALIFLHRFPRQSSYIEKAILIAIEAEGLWSYKDGVTEKGLHFIDDFEEAL